MKKTFSIILIAFLLSSITLRAFAIVSIPNKWQPHQTEIRKKSSEPLLPPEQKPVLPKAKKEEKTNFIKAKWIQYKEYRAKQPTLKERWEEHKENKKEKLKQKRIKRKKERDLEEKRQENIKETLKMEEEKDFRFVKYNSNPGSNELDFFGIYGKRQINTKGIINSNFSKIAYSEVHFYPSVKQLTSEIYIIPLSPFKRVKRRIMDAHVKNRKKIKFYRSGFKKVEDNVFKTLTIIDWSKDNKKLLIKERISKNLEGFLDTKVWVYDLRTDKNYLVKNIKPAVINHWKSKGLDLTKYRWDINPMGWYQYQSDRIIVNVYGYTKKHTKRFLGTWLVGYKDGSAVFMDGTEKQHPVEANGLILKKITNH